MVVEVRKFYSNSSRGIGHFELGKSLYTHLNFSSQINRRLVCMFVVLLISICNTHNLKKKQKKKKQTKQNKRGK